MAQVFRTVVHGYGLNLEWFRQRGETIPAGDSVYVKAENSILIEPMSDRWGFTTAEGDEIAIRELEARQRLIDEMIANIRRSLPAAAAADSSAAGRAQAGVAS